MRHGFSLVELSIVLVILGLLVGGVLAGQSLIRAAELRAVSTEYARYSTALQSFRDKYLALPGDMANAESFWTTLNATDATCRDTVSNTSATCNGDGDGSVETLSTRSREIFRFWQQLANAGLIDGSYTGTWVNSQNWGATLGTNSPKSKASNAGWSIIARLDIVQHAGWYAQMFPPSSDHWLEYGSVVLDSLTQGPTLKNEEAWSIDTKLDDGKPGTGKVTTFNNTRQSNCASSDTSSSATYQLNQSAVACALLMGF